MTDESKDRPGTAPDIEAQHSETLTELLQRRASAVQKITLALDGYDVDERRVALKAALELLN